MTEAYDWSDNARRCYDEGIAALRERLVQSKVVIGDCTLYNEDCRFILPTLRNIDLVATDPPYGIAYTTAFRRVSDAPEMLREDDVPPLDVVPELVKITKDGGALYFCTRFDVSAAWVAALKGSGARVKTPIVWDKGNHTAGDLKGDYGCRTEFVIFAHKGRHLLRQGRDVNLWAIPRPRFGDHPTPKPVELMERMIRNSTSAGDVVLDPFMGEGPTGIAAINSGRKFVGIEIDRKYFQTACRRMEDAYAQLNIATAS